MPYFGDYVFDSQGNVVPGATITVATQAGAAATIYSDALRTTTITSLTTGSDGSYEFYIASGRYTITAQYQGFSQTDTFDLGVAGIETVTDFGADPTGATDSTAAFIAALASLSGGGRLTIPDGTYIIKRGNGGLLADTIPTGNITISGDGHAAVLSCFNAAGAIPNNVGNQFYNVFQAIGKDNITIENLAIEGYGCLGYFDDCENLTVRNVLVNGLLANAGGYLFDKALYFHKCRGVKVHGNEFKNSFFPVYLSGDGSTRTRDVTVSGNNFEYDVAAGSFTASFPCQVYVYFADEVTVTGNTFRNIYSSVDDGTSGTGMGYGVYEGDGACKSLTISGNTFDFTGNGSKNATGILVTEALYASITGNTISADADGRLSDGIRLDAMTTNATRVVCGNTISNLQTNAPAGQYGIRADGISTTNVVSLNVSGNVIYGFTNAVRVEGVFGSIGSSVLLANNICKSQHDECMHFEGAAALPMRFAKITGNTIINSNANGLLFNQHVVTPIVIGNTILDGNLDALATEIGAAIRFTTNSFGAVLIGNLIGNTSGGGGLFTEAVANASSVTSRIFKDIVANNTFLGMAGATSATEFVNFPTVSPTVGIFDIEYGDAVQNNTLNAGGVPGWHCVNVSMATLTSDASNAIGTTVKVASTLGYVAADIVLLCKTNNPYNGDYADTTKWHATTIASVTNGTDFVLTDAIPAGDGTYVSGTAIVKRARFRAAAAIAA